MNYTWVLDGDTLMYLTDYDDWVGWVWYAVMLVSWLGFVVTIIVDFGDEKREK